MRSVQECLIDAELGAFLESPVMIVIGTGAKGAAEIGRGLGAAVEDAGKTLHLVVSAWQWPETVAQARTTGRIAVTFARPADYVTYQVKGQVDRVAPLTPFLRACAERYASGIVQVLAGLGLPPELTAPWRSERDLVALHIRPGQVFVQTPGPHAGSPLGGGDG